jgi:stage V sporulation protein S
MEILKVRRDTRASSLGGAIAEVLRRDGETEVHVIGAVAITQAVTAMAIAAEFVERNGLELSCIPKFLAVQTHSPDLTAIRFVVTAYDQEQEPLPDLEQPGI